jgi:hypothetical protein
MNTMDGGSLDGAGIDAIVAALGASEMLVRFCHSNGLLDLGSIQRFQREHGRFSELLGWNVAIEIELLDLLLAVKRRPLCGNNNAGCRPHSSSIHRGPSLVELTTRHGLAARTVNVLENAGLHYFSDIQDFAVRNRGFAMLRNCGIKTQNEIMAMLAIELPDSVEGGADTADEFGPDYRCVEEFLRLSIRAQHVLLQHSAVRPDQIIALLQRPDHELTMLSGVGRGVLDEWRAMGLALAQKDPLTFVGLGRACEGLEGWAARHGVDDYLLSKLVGDAGNLTLLRFIEHCLSNVWTDTRSRVLLELSRTPEATLSEIGLRIGLTRERVRQILLRPWSGTNSGLGIIHDIPGIKSAYPALFTEDAFMLLNNALTEDLNAREGTNCPSILLAYIAMVLSAGRLEVRSWSDLLPHGMESRRRDVVSPLLVAKELSSAVIATGKSLKHQLREYPKASVRSRLIELVPEGFEVVGREVELMLSTILPMIGPDIMVMDGNIIVEGHERVKMADRLEKVLETIGHPASGDKIVEVWSEKYPDLPTDINRVRSIVVRHSDMFISFGRSSTYALRRWEHEREGVKGGTILDIVEDALSQSPVPLHIEELEEVVRKFRPGTNAPSIRQNLVLDRKGRFWLFPSGFIGLAGRDYPHVPSPPVQVSGSLMRESVLGKFVGRHRSELEVYIMDRSGAAKHRVARVIDQAIDKGRMAVNEYGVICSVGQADKGMSVGKETY